MECERLKGCPFYNDKMPIDGVVGRMYKKKYCEGDKTLCARYQVADKLGKEAVPETLYPNMAEAAREILSKAK